MQRQYFQNLYFVNPYLDQIEYTLGNLSNYLITTENSNNLCILRKDSIPILNDGLEVDNFYSNDEEEFEC